MPSTIDSPLPGLGARPRRRFGSGAQTAAQLVGHLSKIVQRLVAGEQHPIAIGAVMLLKLVKKQTISAHQKRAA